MGTEKRERQKANRAAKLEREAVENRKVETKQKARSWVYIVAGIAGLIGLGLLINYCTAEDSTSTANNSNTTAPPATDADGNVVEAPSSLALAPDELSEAGLEVFEQLPEEERAEPSCPAAEGAERTLDFTGTFEDCLDPAKSYRAIWTTSEGEIVTELDTELTPNTVNNFVALARYGYYDNTAVHRTNAGIDIIQGGSPHNHSGADPGPGYGIEDEGGDYDYTAGTGPFNYSPGDLVMARSSNADGSVNPTGSGAQWFFVTGENGANLNSDSGAPGGGTYITFGKITEGLEVVQAIQALGTPAAAGSRDPSPPRPVVVVESVEIVEYDPADEPTDETDTTEATQATDAPATSEAAPEPDVVNTEAPADDDTESAPIGEAPEGE